jgi:hypothetical protein
VSVASFCHIVQCSGRGANLQKLFDALRTVARHARNPGPSTPPQSVRPTPSARQTLQELKTFVWLCVLDNSLISALIPTEVEHNILMQWGRVPCDVVDRSRNHLLSRLGHVCLINVPQAYELQQIRQSLLSALKAGSGCSKFHPVLSMICSSFISTPNDNDTHLVRL